MADPRKLDPELSEPERRDLVRRIAERGARGYDIKEQTVQPSVDYAAAAQAAVAADPVVLPTAAQEELAGITGAVSEEAGRFAEAQRAIFERGRQRELEAGQRYFDQGEIVREATDYGLARYAEQLAEAAEAARRRSALSAPESLWTPYADETGTGGTQPLLSVATGLHGPRQAILEPVRDEPPGEQVNAAYENFFTTLPPDQIDDALLVTGAYEGLFDEAMNHAQAYFRMGKSQAETEQLLASSLDAAGMATSDATRLAGWIMNSFAPMWESAPDYDPWADDPLSPYRWAPPGMEERMGELYQAPVTGQPANTPRPATYSTSQVREERGHGRDYYAPRTGQAPNDPRRETYSSRWRNTTQPQAGAPYYSVQDTAYGRLIEKYGLNGS